MGLGVEADVAAHLSPLVMFAEDGADEADERLPVGEDAGEVGASAD